MTIDDLTEIIIGCAIEVHKILGPGLLESAYEECLAYELSKAGLSFERQSTLPIIYKEIKLDHGYRLDLVVEEEVIIELKTVESISPVHKAQMLTYMKLSGIDLGLIINFNVKLLKDGIKRFVY